MKPLGLLSLALVLAPLPALAQSTSVFLTAPDDPRAVTVRAVGDGRADDTAALQQAIDAVAADRQRGGGGVVFLPSGRYRISRTIFLRSGVRLFGVGPTRPVILLGDNTPGFGRGIGAMLSFSGEDQYRAGKPPVPPPTSVPANDAIFDATSTTFYSALANVDFEIGDGNAGAVAVRFRVAQHGFLRHVDFRLGSGFAGIYQAGNEADNLRFFGGRYGIVTEKTSPAWQFTLIDSEFSGQREAAIREHEVDLTLVNVAIRDTPVGIEIDRGYSDSLWGKNVRFENVSRAGVLISSEQSVFTQVGFDNAVGVNTPVFARFRESGRTIPGQGAAWRVADFSHGLKVPAIGEMGRTATDVTITPLPSAPPRVAPALPLLPPVSEWANARALGAKGDDQSDDTAALQRAIDRNRVVYLPTGRYRITDTLKLRPDSVLISLHPNQTQLYLPENAPRFAGVGGARGMIESAKGGAAIVYGLGLYAGGVNPRASNIIWRAGEQSMINDVRIHGPVVYVNGKATGGGIEPESRWDGQQASIWVTDNGGGTFNAIWTPNGLAHTGFYVTDTKTPGHVYELSAEHHFKNEIVLRNVENWEFLAPQTEQEVRDGVYAVSTEFHNSRNILFANYHGYRVTRTAKPMDTAVRLVNSGDIRFRNVHINAESAYAHCDTEGCGTYVRASKYPFENAIKDLTTGQEVREREFAKLDVPAATPRAATPAPLPVTAGVTKLADGFYSVAGGAVDRDGKLYFVDRFHQRIHGWSSTEGLTTVSQATLDPVNLAVDRSGRLLVLSSAGRDGTVFSIDPKEPDDVRVIDAGAPRAGAAVALPVNVWANGEFADRIDQRTYQYPPLSDFFTSKMGEPKSRAYLSPDGSVAIPAFRVWNQGPDDHQGWRWSDTLDSYGLVTARSGERVWLSNASENLTYSGRVAASGALSDLRVVAPRGGESVARGRDGTLYVANGQVWVYDKDGKEIRRIDVPERPLQLLIGGADGRTLFILAHHALYSVPI
ncbi:Sugar lactone lactonase YvrE [Sphingomonas guangdongensis]|uniref:Sugar lactone lactonase YvrE n=1 Tax=Sphingomonas guangdongensis TaxID=1141890 RepID=A0A285QWQ8_9SPHN|nr:glycosyl hydrolase family 28-related protein [Sphingomonas guangdongensis]SOB86405.1 Sugar lactone lactonase YvrE [Sphingomonas guangdongensis]